MCFTEGPKLFAIGERDQSQLVAHKNIHSDPEESKSQYETRST